MTARVLNANINPSFTLSPSKNAKHGAPGRHTETAREFGYRGEEVTVNKERFLRTDAIKTYVEKALALHDDRKGMPVVASPIWAPKTTGGGGGGG